MTKKLLLIALLGCGAGCAAPGGEQPAVREPADAAPGSEGAEAGAAEGSPVEGAVEGEPPAEAEAAASPEGGPGPAAGGEEAVPRWWSSEPVRRGGAVSVCAEATAPTLREAREQAIKAGYRRLEEELGGPADRAVIGGDYQATEVAGAWRFRVRVTGSRQ